MKAVHIRLALRFVFVTVVLLLDSIGGVSAHESGDVYVVGQTFGTLPGQTSAGGADGFVVKIVEVHRP